MTSKEIKPATPLPWHVGLRQAEQIVYDAKGWAVANATVYHGAADVAETKANARYIAHACNAYPRLVEALRTLEKDNYGQPSAVTVRALEPIRALLQEPGESK